MDFSRGGVPALSAETRPSGATVDLHLHSTASDGVCSPEEVVERGARLGLTALALTDHDTVAGVSVAQAAGSRCGVRVICGCEFSVAAGWGEMHVLGYFLPPASADLENFLAQARAMRERRGQEIVSRLQDLGVEIDQSDLHEAARGGAIGRPHVARALVKRGAAVSIDDAFDRLIGRGRPGFVAKELPSFREVAELVHRVGGILSAAHLKDRGTRSVLRRLQEAGLDAVETRHPGHDADRRATLTEHARALRLLRTGGSDWHGDSDQAGNGAAMGSQAVPAEWLERLEAARPTPSTPNGP